MRPIIFAIYLIQACAANRSLNRNTCQYPTAKPLEGCPNNTILVGLGQKHATVQSAVLSLPNDASAHHILIQPGNYTEQINITRPGPVYLLGQTTFPDDQSKNAVHIIWRNATGAEANSTLDNAYTSTLTVAPTFESSKTGSGPTGMSRSPSYRLRTLQLNFI
jgi:pectin methylesterase-like acyl-CoA thioesterase